MFWSPLLSVHTSLTFELFLFRFCVPFGFTTTAFFFALLLASCRSPDARGTLDSRLRSIFTTNSWGGLTTPLLFPGWLWAVLWGFLESFRLVFSSFGLLIFTGGCRDKWSDWVRLWLGQEQRSGYVLPQDVHPLCGPSLTSSSDPAFGLFEAVCLVVLLLSFLESFSLLFLQCFVFIFTLGLSVKPGSLSLSLVTDVSSRLTLSAASPWSVQSSFAGFVCVLHVGFLSSSEGQLWLLFWWQLFSWLWLCCWGLFRSSTGSVCRLESWGLESLQEPSTSALECLELGVDGSGVWAVLSETWTVLGFCWLNLINWLSCQTSLLTAGAPAWEKTQQEFIRESRTSFSRPSVTPV